MQNKKHFESFEQNTKSHNYSKEYRENPKIKSRKPSLQSTQAPKNVKEKGELQKQNVFN